MKMLKAILLRVLRSSMALFSNADIVVLFLIIIGLSTALISGCNRSPAGESTTQKDNYVVKVIDGCEYIECDYGLSTTRTYSLTHKGDCKNPIHYYLLKGNVIPKADKEINQ